MSARRLCGILAAATLLTACAPSAAETRQLDESRSGSGASEWFDQLLLNLTSPPRPPSVDPLGVIAGIDEGESA